MPTERYRNQTGGLLCVPRPGNNPELEGNIIGWDKVKDGKDFDAEVDDKGVLSNPGLRVAARAEEFGIVPSKEAKPKAKKRGRPPGKRTRKL